MSHPNKSAADRGRASKLAQLTDGAAMTVGSITGVGRLEEKAKQKQALPKKIAEGVGTKVRLDRKSRGGKVRKRAEGGPVPGEAEEEAAPSDPSPYAGQEMRSYSPTMRERIAQRLSGDVPTSPTRQNFIKGLMGTSGLGEQSVGLVDATPASIPLGVDESVRAGDTQGAVLSMAPLGPAARAGHPSKDLSRVLRRKVPREELHSQLYPQFDEVARRLRRGEPWSEATENISGALTDILERVVSPEQRAASNARSRPDFADTPKNIQAAKRFMANELGVDPSNYVGNDAFAITDALEHGWRPQGVTWGEGPLRGPRPGTSE